ncbi:GatB/YqeY domain-containing protein [Poriferisphaera sp. WC338]|uniref:GatB/YqeY domain-containing protein n=1 Tax=Poriferisphaera sp. WC338 TaxID=3425129 RepID=UPI003D8167DC
MGMIEDIRARIKKAMIERNDLEKSILKVALGDLDTEAARSAEGISEEKCEQIIRKMVKSANETLEHTTDAAEIEKINAEKAILGTLLPTSLSVAEIKTALEAVLDDVKAVGNDGQATGVAMKHLKSQGAVVIGKDVSQAVHELRGS